jgi:uncharacterized protein (DUF433 family)
MNGRMPRERTRAQRGRERPSGVRRRGTCRVWEGGRSRCVVALDPERRVRSRAAETAARRSHLECRQHGKMRTPLLSRRVATLATRPLVPIRGKREHSVEPVFPFAFPLLTPYEAATRVSPRRVHLRKRGSELSIPSGQWTTPDGKVDSPLKSSYAGLVELHAPSEQVPIQADVNGVIRVGGTRVTLDTVVAAFDAGATAEEIVQQYPSVALADICSVIPYYLRHQSEVRAYFAQRQRHATQVREENERRFNPTGVRDRLLARRR